MAKLIYAAIASLDGYVEDEEGRFDWAAPDDEVHAFVNDLEREGHTNSRFAHAAKSYSWISPPRMSRRRSCAVETNAAGSLPSPCGTRRPSPRWGRLAL
jgi:hypothetical protein